MNLPVEQHLDGATLRQNRIGPTRKQYTNQANRSPRRCTDARPGQAAATGRRASDTTNGRAGGRAGGNRGDVAAFIAFALDLALFAVEVFSSRAVHGAHPRAEVAHHAVGENQRVKPHIEFAAALQAARSFYTGNRTRHIRAGGNHNASARHDGEHRFEVNPIAFERMLRTDAIQQAQRNLRTRIQRIDFRHTLRLILPESQSGQT